MKCGITDGVQMESGWPLLLAADPIVEAPDGLQKMGVCCARCFTEIRKCFERLK